MAEGDVVAVVGERQHTLRVWFWNGKAVLQNGRDAFALAKHNLQATANMLPTQRTSLLLKLFKIRWGKASDMVPCIENTQR